MDTSRYISRGVIDQFGGFFPSPASVRISQTAFLSERRRLFEALVCSPTAPKCQRIFLGTFLIFAASARRKTEKIVIDWRVLSSMIYLSNRVVPDV